MQLGLRTLICVLGTMVCCSGVLAVNDNPYQGIVDRNVFGLHPPPPPPVNEPPKPPIPPITLTGITTILGKKLAFMNVQFPPKPGEQGKGGPQSFMLGEGEREGEIEVVTIDDKGGSVTVKESGTITNVTFGKLPATPAPAVAGGVGVPGAMPAANHMMPAANGQRSIPGLPTRTLRLGNQNGTPGSSGPGTINPAGTAPTLGVPGASPQAANEPPQPQISPEEQAVMMEIERTRLNDAHDPVVNLIPPTALTPGQNNQSNPNNRRGSVPNLMPQ